MSQTVQEATPESTQASSSQVTENKRVTSFYKQKKEVHWIPAIFLVSVHIIALVFAPFTFSWSTLVLCLVLHWVTGGLGITLCYHRLLTHRSFKVAKPVEYLLTMFASLCCQGGPIAWVTAHRLHHAQSDQDLDPHSPTQGGFWWSHMGWCMAKNENIDTKEAQIRYAPDLVNDKGHQFFEKTHILWTILLGLGLYALGGWSFVVWGIFVRMVLVYHCTWLVNSAAHIWGYKTYDSKDDSTNLWWVALMTYGEGWHNNHHAFQSSAKHGLRWWEVDTTYMAIKFLEFFKLASAIKLPSEHQLATKANA